MTPPRRKHPTRLGWWQWQDVDGQWLDDIQEAEYSYREITEKDDE